MSICHYQYQSPGMSGGGGGGGGSSYSNAANDHYTDPDALDISDYILFDAALPADNFVSSGSSTRRSEERDVDQEGSLHGPKRIAFRTKSDVEIMDDGFKWRKYGKKSLKNSPNPRNYYKCSTEGCSVKKRAERDGEDPSYVITTYDGIHNHTTPGIAYFAARDEYSGQIILSRGQIHPDS